MVLAGDQQRVAVEERPDVEEGERDVVLEDDLGRRLAGDDRAEEAVGIAVQATIVSAPGSIASSSSAWSPM